MRLSYPQMIFRANLTTARAHKISMQKFKMFTQCLNVDLHYVSDREPD